MNDYAKYTADRLKTSARQRDRSTLLCLMVSGLAIALFAFLVTAILDHWLVLPLWGRIAAFAVAAISIFAGAAGMIYLWWRRTGPKDAALEMESQRPELGCVVSTAAEYLQSSPESRDGSGAGMIQALQGEAARRLLLVEPDYYRKVLWGVACVMASLVGIGVFWMAAGSATTAFARALSPWANTPYCQLQVKPGNTGTPRGGKVTIRATADGRMPNSLALLVRRGPEMAWERLTMEEADKTGEFARTIDTVEEPIRYRVTGKTATSKTYRITPYVPPSVDGIKIGVDCPDYTGLDRRVVHSPNLTVVRGSELSYSIGTSGNIAKGKLKFADRSNLSLKQSGDGSWGASFLPKSGCQYWIEVSDTNGRTALNDQPYRVSVVPDQPPEVTISDPGKDIRSGPTNQIPVEITVTDDFGVNEVKLVYQKVGGSKREMACSTEKVSAGEVKATATIDLGELNLKPYELVSYYAKARDNNRMDGPGIGKSSVYFIEYTTNATVLSQCRGGGKRINILQIEKQIIAATEKADSEAPAERFGKLTSMQKEAKKFAELFQNSFILSVSPDEAKAEFKQAIASMAEAATFLSNRRKQPALEREQDALGHLYQAARLLPDLRSMCQGGSNKCTKIVLQAIEKLKKQQQVEQQEGLTQAIRRAEKIANRQAKLNKAYKQSGKEGEEGTLSKRQSAIAQKAKRLAKTLRGLSGRDSRISYRVSRRTEKAARKWQNAAGAVRRDQVAQARDSALKGGSILREVISDLRRIYHGRNRPTKLADQRYPKEFEGLVAEYFKRLSYAE